MFLLRLFFWLVSGLEYQSVWFGVCSLFKNVLAVLGERFLGFDGNKAAGPRELRMPWSAGAVARGTT